MKNLAVIQARMASNRLPGKVLKQIGNKRAIGWAVNAALRTSGVDKVVVATSVNEENGVIEDWCKKQGVECFRGSEDDVLNRYCELIRIHEPESVLRLTADCPFLDSHVISDLVALHEAMGNTYTTNQWPPTWPDGLDCEIIKASALLEAEKEATSPTDRDTVTQYIWRNQSRWPASNLTCPLPLEQERWVLDSPEDLQLMQIIALAFPAEWEPRWQDIWHLLNRNPELREINKNWWRNQRFFEAMTKEEEPHKYTRSQAQLERASKVIPNASQTYSKSCLSFPPTGPLFCSHGSGCYLFDIDGNRYVDLVASLLPNILGYADADVDYAIRNQLDRGISPSLATELETELAELMVGLIPCAEMVRFGKNGSDATTGAVRLARAFTGFDKVGIIQTGEGYHGWHDWAIAGTPRDVGVPGIVKSLTDRMEPEIHSITEKLCRHRYAAIIIDPENHDVTFLADLKKACAQVGAVLIFDEIRTGFRYDLGGYQKYTGVIPDLACFGKSMANGMPISAICGPKQLMEGLGRKDGTFWSGTFFGETLSLAAAIATIRKLRDYDVPTYLWKLGKQLMAEIKGNDTVKIGGLPPRPTITFTGDDTRLRFMKCMADEGVLIINSMNICYAINDNEVDKIISAFKKVLN